VGTQPKESKPQAIPVKTDLPLNEIKKRLQNIKIDLVILSTKGLNPVFTISFFIAMGNWYLV
jgi:hypothetical protein